MFATHGAQSSQAQAQQGQGCRFRHRRTSHRLAIRQQAGESCGIVRTCVEEAQREAKRAKETSLVVGLVSPATDRGRLGKPIGRTGCRHLLTIRARRTRKSTAVARHMSIAASNGTNCEIPCGATSVIFNHYSAACLKVGIDLRLGTELDAIFDDNGDGKADAIQIKNGEKLPCQFVGLTVGVSPNIDFLKNTPLSIDKGIKVNNYLETNQLDVYAIGDCAQLETPQTGRRPIEAIWYTGKMMGETVAYNIVGKKVAYNPGIWFNSAKFLDIEYQVYGDIRATKPDEHESLYWEHTDGKHAIRINFDKNTEGVVGFNLMGVRYRHEVCEKWIQNATKVETVLQNLGLANFDPEFYREYEQEVVNIYNQTFNKSLQLKTKRGLNAVTRFLKAAF